MGKEGVFSRRGFFPLLSVLRHHHPHPPPGLKRGVCVKINHFPEDTDYDHDSAEYLLRTWGSESEWVGGAAGAGAERGGRGGGAHLDRQAGKNLPASPEPEAEILWTPIGSVIPLPPPPLTLGRAEGGIPGGDWPSYRPSSRRHCSVTGCRFLGWDWPLRPGSEATCSADWPLSKAGRGSRWCDW